jgi:hypothetical protein
MFKFNFCLLHLIPFLQAGISDGLHYKKEEILLKYSLSFIIIFPL